MLVSLLLNLNMFGGVTPPPVTDFYLFECSESISIIEKESSECLKTSHNSLNTNNKIIANSLNSCS